MKTFDKPGFHNSEECMKLASERAKELGIKEIVVATNAGDMAYLALKYFEGCRIIAVTHHAGFKKPWTCEMHDETRDDLISKGVAVLTTSHALSGIERSFRNKYQGLYPMELVADTLRIFGQGTKVCVEITLMAADAGLLSGGDIMTIGGSGKGADTAIVIKPVLQKEFLNMKVHEIVCKPWLD